VFAGAPLGIRQTRRIEGRASLGGREAWSWGRSLRIHAGAVGRSHRGSAAWAAVSPWACCAVVRAGPGLAARARSSDWGRFGLVEKKTGRASGDAVQPNCVGKRRRGALATIRKCSSRLLTLPQCDLLAASPLTRRLLTAVTPAGPAWFRAVQGRGRRRDHGTP